MIIISTNKIVAYLCREIEDLENEIIEYKSKMDGCICFSKEYWQYHDKYQVAFIKKSCLADLLSIIEREWIKWKDLENDGGPGYMFAGML